MYKASDAVRQIVQQNSILEFGLREGLLNLSQVARFIKSLVEARCKKEVSESSILMTLSRLGQKQSIPKQQKPRFEIDNLNIHSDLAVLSVYKSPEMHRSINALYQRLSKQGSYITISEGLTEITIIIESRDLALAKEKLKGKLQHCRQNISSISVKFKPEYVGTPGFLLHLLQKVAFQNINIVEVASTTTEFIFYLDSEDIRLAFDTLCDSFSNRN